MSGMDGLEELGWTAERAADGNGPACPAAIRGGVAQGLAVAATGPSTVVGTWSGALLLLPWQAANPVAAARRIAIASRRGDTPAPGDRRMLGLTGKRS